MANQIINTANAPAPIGPYNQAIKTGNLLFISGQVALVPGTDTLITDNIGEETHQVMKNLQAILTRSRYKFQQCGKDNYLFK